MVQFAIIEVEDGLTVVEVQPNQSPEEVALKHGGTLIDAGPYASYEEANDALLDLESDDEDDERA
jgi:hypothetical protein